MLGVDTKAGKWEEFGDMNPGKGEGFDDGYFSSIFFSSISAITRKSFRLASAKYFGDSVLAVAANDLKNRSTGSPIDWGVEVIEVLVR